MADCTADQIAERFATRLPEAGGWVSAKQIDWLLATFARENGIPRPRTASGVLPTDGRDWVARKSGNANGCGTLHFAQPTTPEDAAKARADYEYQQRCVLVNEQVATLLFSGKLDEARNVLMAFQTEEAAR